MTDYRAELQRLVEAYDEHGGKWPDHHEQALFQSVEDARAALAQLEPVAPTDEELDGLFDAHCCTDDFGTHLMDAACFRDGVRALLNPQPVSQPYKLPKPVAPTDEELLASVRHFYGDQTAADMGAEDDLCTARAVLARYGTAAIQPVQVSERLPEAGDWVWHCYAGVRFWIHGRYNGRQFFIGDGPKSQPATHWLPANALPTPRLSRD
jgi:hypothetical protein